MQFNIRFVFDLEVLDFMVLGCGGFVGAGIGGVISRVSARPEQGKTNQAGESSTAASPLRCSDVRNCSIAGRKIDPPGTPFAVF